jgi:hypothetical protein
MGIFHRSLLLIYNFAQQESPLPRKPPENLPNDFQTLSEIFHLSSVTTLMFPNITKAILQKIDPLSVLPTVQEHSKHCREHSLINDHQGDLKGHNDPCAFYEDILSLNHKHRFHIPFFVILAMSEI